jgi:hypothetical protein
MSTTPPAADLPALDRRAAAAVDAHRAAVAAYLETARALAEDAWERPWAEGKWTPAQVTEHLSLGYEALLAEIVEGRPMKAKLPRWRQTLLRWVLLPHILFHRTFPIRAPAPRETRPAEARAPRDEALQAFAALSERFEAEVAAAGARGFGHLTHPYFGAVALRKALPFVSIHIEHHRRQIAHLA